MSRLLDARGIIGGKPVAHARAFKTRPNPRAVALAVSGSVAQSTCVNSGRPAAPALTGRKLSGILRAPFGIFGNPR